MDTDTKTFDNYKYKKIIFIIRVLKIDFFMKKNINLSTLALYIICCINTYYV